MNLLSASFRSSAIKTWGTRVALMIGFFSFYWLTRNFNLNVDGPVSLAGMEKVFFHAYHLLHSFVFRAFYMLYVQFFSVGELRALPAALLLNSVLGAVGVSVFFSILQKRTDWSIALLATLILGISKSYWKYVTYFEIYCASVFASILVLYLALNLRPGFWRIVALSAAFTFSVTMHAYNVMLFMGLLYAVCRANYDHGRGCVRPGVQFTALSLMMGIGVYAFVGVVFNGIRTQEHVYGFLFGYLDPALAGDSWWSFHLANVKVTIKALFDSIVPMKNSTRALSVLPLVVAAALLGWRACVEIVSKWARTPSVHIVLLMIVGYGIFFTVWDVGNDEFHPQYPALLLFLAAIFCQYVLQRFRRVAALAPLAYCILLALWINIPLMRKEHYPVPNYVPTAVTLSIYQQHATTDDLLFVVPPDYTRQVFFDYFLQRGTRSFVADAPDLTQQLLAAIREAKGNTFIEEILWNRADPAFFDAERVMPSLWGTTNGVFRLQEKSSKQKKSN